MAEPEPLRGVRRKRPEPELKRRFSTWTDGDGRVFESSVYMRPTRGNWKNYEYRLQMEAATPIGDLVYYPAKPDWGLMWRHLFAKGEQHWTQPTPGAGTVSPKAKVITLRSDPLVVAAALDSTKPDMPHFDVVRLDLTGKGRFQDALTVPRTRLDHDRDGKFLWSYTFSQLPLYVERDGHRIPVQVEISYNMWRDATWISIDWSTYAEGMCRFGDAEHKVRVLDGNGNLQLGDAFRPIMSKHGNSVEPEGRGDTLFINVGSEEHKDWRSAFYGHPVLVDGALYMVEISADGEHLSAHPYTGKTGFVRINHPLWQAWLIGNRHMLSLKAGPQPVPVPLDRYRVLQYEEWTSTKKGEDEKRGEWSRGYVTLTDPKPGEKGDVTVEVAAGQTVDVRIGSPLVTHLIAVPQPNGTVDFRLVTWDASGRSFSHSDLKTPEQRHRGAPVIEITDGAGNTVEKVTTARCRTWGEFTATWNPPDRRRGTFTATADWGVAPFELKAQRVTFTIP